MENKSIRCDVLIELDATSKVLETRWVACYMLYDWNLRHAWNAFDANEPNRVKAAKDLFIKTITHPDDLDPAERPRNLTEAYNMVLAEDVDSFIDKHIEVMHCSRSFLEHQLARVIAEVYQI